MERSSALFEFAKAVLVGGVNSPVRAFKSVGGHPIFFRRAEGPYLISEDGDRFLDYVLSWGPMILGHAHPVVTRDIIDAVGRGTSFGAPTAAETQLAQLVQSFFPSMARVRFVNSGTEACMSAIRLARGFTGRRRIIKFDGCYHGHADSLLVAAGSGALTHGEPDSAGVLPELAAFTTVLPYNDLAAVTDAFRAIGHDVAAVIVEPVCGNMGLVLPDSAFLSTLRSLCSEHGALLIFDEVMTGFRVALGGAQSAYGITPDLTCLGKVIGGGLPCAAYGGRADIMQHLSPIGPVYQAGTLSGNPVAMAAGIATLTQLQDGTAFDQAAQHTAALCGVLDGLIADHGWPITVQSKGTMWSLFFAKGPIRNLDDVKRCNTQQFAAYYHNMLSAGVYMAPSQYESNFVSCQHGDAQLQTMKDALTRCLTATLSGK